MQSIVDFFIDLLCKAMLTCETEDICNTSLQIIVIIFFVIVFIFKVIFGFCYC